MMRLIKLHYLVHVFFSIQSFRHETLMYGRFKSQPIEQDEKAAKLARLSKMKKIYLPPRISPSKMLTVFDTAGSFSSLFAINMHGLLLCMF